MSRLTLLWTIYGLSVFIIVAWMLKITLKFKHRYLVTYEYENDDVSGFGDCSISLNETLKNSNLKSVRETISKEVEKLGHKNATIVFLNIIKL